MMMAVDMCAHQQPEQSAGIENSVKSKPRKLMKWIYLIFRELRWRDTPNEIQATAARQEENVNEEEVADSGTHPCPKPIDEFSAFK